MLLVYLHQLLLCQSLYILVCQTWFALITSICTSNVILPGFFLYSFTATFLLLAWFFHLRRLSFVLQLWCFINPRLYYKFGSMIVCWIRIFLHGLLRIHWCMQFSGVGNVFIWECSLQAQAIEVKIVFSLVARSGNKDGNGDGTRIVKFSKNEIRGTNKERTLSFIDIVVFSAKKFIDNYFVSFYVRYIVHNGQGFYWMDLIYVKINLAGPNIS